MINIANATEEDRKIIFLNTAEKLKMHPAVIEKDFWVCFVLHHLFQKSQFSNAFLSCDEIMVMGNAMAKKKVKKGNQTTYKKFRTHISVSPFCINKTSVLYILSWRF